MPRIDVPIGQDPMVYAWTAHAEPLTTAATNLADAVYTRSILPLRELEAARVRIAHINDCAVCRAFRTARDVPARNDDPDVVPEALYDHVLDPGWAGYTPREALAIRFAELFALDHLAMDDTFWDEMHMHFSDEEIVDLTACVGYFVAFGRFNRVLEIDGACQIPNEVLRTTVEAARHSSV